MTARSSATQRPCVVGVIASRADLGRALRMRKPPDLFELRLDRLAGIVDQLENKLPMLRAKARAAKTHGADIFKVATCTDTPVQLARLLDFITGRDIDLPVSAMGIGKLGAISRVLLARAGSALVYASLTAATDIEGQLSLEQLRALGIGTMTKPE